MPFIGEDGRAPESPDPAYQQILKGIPAADFSAEELLYLLRNVRTHRLRYDENINVTRCIYRTPVGTCTHEYNCYVSCPETMPAP